MTIINLNNQSLNHEYNANSSLDSIIDKIQLDSNGTEIITKIEVDGISVSNEDENTVCSKAISNFNTINFQTKTSVELAYEALDSCTEYINILIEKIQLVSLNFLDNKVVEANAEFAEIIELLDLLVQLITKVNKTIHSQIDIKYQKSETIKRLEIHLLSVLKALIPAKEKNDIIMLCDLLEYELVDNLIQWKIKAIPELKKMKTN